jgi:hypothetical protein
MLPFTREQFIAVFADYNAAIFPAQLVAYFIGLSVVVLLLRRSNWTDRVIGGGLAVLWLWTGVAYHGLFFASINKAAVMFGALFVVQGALFLYAALARNTLTFGPGSGFRAWIGWGLVLYATAVYPLLGMWAGHRYPEMPMFGVTPCPVTLFTLGVLLLSITRVPRWMLVVPFIWSVIGGSAAFALGVPEDWPLLLSGVVAVPLVVLRDRKWVQPSRHLAKHHR